MTSNMKRARQRRQAQRTLARAFDVPYRMIRTRPIDWKRRRAIVDRETARVQRHIGDVVLSISMDMSAWRQMIRIEDRGMAGRSFAVGENLPTLMSMSGWASAIEYTMSDRE